MPEFLRPIAARVLGWAVATLATWLASKYGIIIPEDAQHQITAYGATAIVSIWGGVYFLVHRGASIKTNPSDAASPKMAEQEKEVRDYDSKS